MPAPAILLKPGEEKKEYEFQSHNLGTKAISIDGRVFRYSKMGATVGVAGNVYQAAVPVANHLAAVCDVARDVGATQISATLGATAASIDDYAEGTAHVNKAGGLGHTYIIHRAWRPGDGHAAVASAGILTANL